MSSLTVIQRDGVSRTVEATVGHSVMEIIRDSGVDELLALCGGCCSCATCHVYVFPEGAHLLPPMSNDEDDLLDSSSHRKPLSRLSCQIRFEGAMDSMTVELAPED